MRVTYARLEEAVASSPFQIRPANGFPGAVIYQGRTQLFSGDNRECLAFLNGYALADVEKLAHQVMSWTRNPANHGDVNPYELEFVKLSNEIVGDVK